MNLQGSITSFTQKLQAVVLSLIVGFMIVGCVPQEELDEKINVPSAAIPPLPNLDVACYHDRYQVPEKDITRKIDILVVPDTSGSIIDERAAIADGFDAFLGALPNLADVRVSVMLGHGSLSSRSGKLYQRGTEPLILDNQVHTIDEIKSNLKVKMQNPHTDGHSDGGEEGLYSLYNSLTDDTKFQAMQDAGFFRDDAALVVVFVADEQDICASFPEGVTPVPDPQGKEDSSFARDCVDGSGNRIITPEIVLNKLKEKVGDRPLVVGGVVYNNLNTIPFKGENELGYGYLEIIEKAGGITVDMANGEYGNGLSKLGTLAMTKIEPVNNFNPKVSNVDPATIITYVNGAVVPHTYNSELNMVSLVNERDALSVADLQYCEKPKITKQVYQLASGGFHNCALLATGDVKCWGRNNSGQLGLGHMDNVGDVTSAEDAAIVPLGEKAIQLIAGVYHTCALLQSGNVRCWGQNNFGQLGLGHTNSIGDDEAITEAPYVSLGGTVRKLYAGTYHNCALFTNGGVKCWGWNQYGQLGIGNTNNIGDDELPSTSSNVDLGGSALQMDLSTISAHACAILDGGSLKCWGQNSSGQLGLGHTNNIGDDEAVSSAPLVDVGRGTKMVTTGNMHTCALLSDNSIKCFGGNNFGQLGLGHMDNIGDDEVPSSIGSINLGFEANYIYSGNFSTCAVSGNGGVKCWGHGATGKLGQGNSDNIGDDEVPNDVANINLGGDVIESVIGGVNHHCFLTKDKGLIKCIGQGTFGQLGNGDTANIGDDESPSTTNFLELLKI